jgi:hypothetical protein
MPVSSLILLCGILALISGGSFLALVPITAKSLREQLQTGKITAAEVSKRLRTIMVIGLAQMIVGCGLAISYALHLYD